jgi:hypothetical protein
VYDILLENLTSAVAARQTMSIAVNRQPAVDGKEYQM